MHPSWYREPSRMLPIRTPEIVGCRGGSISGQMEIFNFQLLLAVGRREEQQFQLQSNWSSFEIVMSVPSISTRDAWLTNDADDLRFCYPLRHSSYDGEAWDGQVATRSLDDSRQVAVWDPSAVWWRSDARAILSNVTTVQHPSDPRFGITVGRCALERNRVIHFGFTRAGDRHRFRGNCIRHSSVSLRGANVKESKQINWITSSSAAGRKNQSPLLLSFQQRVDEASFSFPHSPSDWHTRTGIPLPLRPDVVEKRRRKREPSHIERFQDYCVSENEINIIRGRTVISRKTSSSTDKSLSGYHRAIEVSSESCKLHGILPSKETKVEYVRL